MDIQEFIKESDVNTDGLKQEFKKKAVTISVKIDYLDAEWLADVLAKNKDERAAKIIKAIKKEL